METKNDDTIKKELQNNKKEIEEDKDDSDNDDFVLNTKTSIIKKIFIFFIIVIFISLFGLFALQKIINLESKKIKINEQFKALIKEQVGELNEHASIFNIKGSMLFHSFPLPNIVLNDVNGINLTENGYKVNFNIKKINLFLSPLALLKKEIIITKIEIIDGNFDIREVDGLKYDIIKTTLMKYFEKNLSKNLDIVFITKNTNIIITTKEFKRELTSLNLNIAYYTNKVTFIGNFISNKQPLNIKMNFLRNKNNFDGDINLNTQPFNGNINLKADLDNMDFSGKVYFDIINFQLFSRALFNTNNFMYKRIIDNGDLKINFDFLIKDKKFVTNNIILDGRSIKAKSDIVFNFNENNENKINFVAEHIHLDNLMTKNIVGKTPKNQDDIEISIFSDQEPKFIDIKKHTSFLEKLFKINPTLFDIKIKTFIINQEYVLNTELNFIYKEKTDIKINKIATELPGKTNLLIEKNNNKNLIILKGEDLYKFWEFLKNSKNSTILETANIKDVKKEFTFDGDLEINKNKLFIKNANYTMNDFKSQNQIEVDFNAGISYIAINTIVDNLTLDHFINFENKPSQNQTFKNKILFLNNFTLATFLKFKINNIQYKEIKDKDYNFTIKTIQGLLNIYNINLNNKINGNISFDILNANPNINANFNIQNLKITDGIDFNKILFQLPTFEDFLGNIIINANNINFKNSLIPNLNMILSINKGIFNFNNFQIDIFNGNCNINGYLSILYNKKLNLKFVGCTAELKDILSLFTGITHINGLIGFSSILYAEGTNIDSFIASYLFKTQLVGSGIKINKFGLTDLNTILFDINSDENLLIDLNLQNILYNEKFNTLFEKMSGNLNYSKKNNGEFDFDISRTMINGKLKGTFELFNDFVNIKSSLTLIMLTGTLEKTLPLTILIGINGNTANKMNISTNFQQVDTYIESVKKELQDSRKYEKEIKKLEKK